MTSCNFYKKFGDSNLVWYTMFRFADGSIDYVEFRNVFGQGKNLAFPWKLTVYCGTEFSDNEVSHPRFSRFILFFFYLQRRFPRLDEVSGFLSTSRNFPSPYNHICFRRGFPINGAVDKQREYHRKRIKAENAKISFSFSLSLSLHTIAETAEHQEE